MRSCRYLLLFLALLATPIAAPAQEAANNNNNNNPKEMTYAIGRLEFAPKVMVSNVDSKSGEVTLVPENPELTAFVTEGLFVLLPASPETKNVYRVQVTEVEPGKGFTIKVAPETASTLAKGTKLLLIRPLKTSSRQIRAIPEVVALGSSTTAAEGDAITASREAFSLNQSVINLKQMGLALHNFHSTNGSFPPAVIHGPDGKPWHSWRTIILPFLEETRVYNEYNFSRPWDNEKNLKVLEKMPSVYRDPVYGDSNSKFTNYAAVVGKGTAFPAEGTKMKKPNLESFIGDGKGATPMARITDGTSNTVGIVPVSPDRKIPWTKPEDIEFSADFPGFGKPGGIAVPYHLGGKKNAPGLVPMLFMDGSVKSISALIEPKVLTSLLTIMGGEIIDQKALNVLGGFSPAAAVPTLVITTKNGKVSASIR